eukprot:659385-Rhodomonas_salina.1
MRDKRQETREREREEDKIEGKRGEGRGREEKRGKRGKRGREREGGVSRHGYSTVLLYAPTMLLYHATVHLACGSRELAFTTTCYCCVLLDGTACRYCALLLYDTTVARSTNTLRAIAGSSVARAFTTES